MGSTLDIGELLNRGVVEAGQQLAQGLYDEGYKHAEVITSLRLAEISIAAYVNKATEVLMADVEVTIMGRTLGVSLRVDGEEVIETASSEWAKPDVPYGGGRD